MGLKDFWLGAKTLDFSMFENLEAWFEVW